MLCREQVVDDSVQVWKRLCLQLIERRPPRRNGRVARDVRSNRRRTVGADSLVAYEIASPRAHGVNVVDHTDMDQRERLLRSANRTEIGNVTDGNSLDLAAPPDDEEHRCPRTAVEAATS